MLIDLIYYFITTEVCTENQFQCSNGDCINAEFVCDKFRDCADASDEHDCGKIFILYNVIL